MKQNTTFNGEPCLHGHTERYLSTGSCAICARESARRNHAADPKRAAAKAKRRYDANPQHYRDYARRWRAENPARHRRNKAKYYQRHKERLLTELREKGYKRRNIPEPTRPRPDNCEICGGVDRRGHSLHLDHCHLTNKFRGWICSQCNLGLGNLGDNLETMRKAVRYLENAE